MARVLRSRLSLGEEITPCDICDIRDLSVCAALTEDQLVRLASITSAARYWPRQTIFNEGDPAAHLFNVTGGVAKIFKLLRDGRRQITGFLFPGDFLGLAVNDTYAYSAEAITETSLCRFPRLKFEALLQELPKMESRLRSLASNELAAAQDQMLLLGRKTAREKIASFLVLLQSRSPRRGQPPASLPLPMSRTDMADYLGLTIETVSRTLTRFKKSGIVSAVENGHVFIEDEEDLEKVAQGG